MIMTVCDIITMFVEENKQYFELWDNKNEKIIFKGYLSDLSDDLLEATVTSIDNVTNGTNGITLNVETP